jgi:hypothetical protein
MARDDNLSEPLIYLGNEHSFCTVCSPHPALDHSGSAERDHVCNKSTAMPHTRGPSALEGLPVLQTPPG